MDVINFVTILNGWFLKNVTSKWSNKSRPVALTLDMTFIFTHTAAACDTMRSQRLRTQGHFFIFTAKQLCLASVQVLRLLDCLLMSVLLCRFTGHGCPACYYVRNLIYMTIPC